MDEEFDGGLGARASFVMQHPHVGRYAADPQQPGLMIQHVLRSIDAHAPHQRQHHAGIQAAAARAHHQAIQRRSAHRRLDAAPGLHRAQAGAAAQMCDHHPAGGEVRRQFGGNVFVGQAMKPVAAHAQPLRQGVAARDIGHGAMECGVEAGDLGKAGLCFRDGGDGGQVVRLMQRRQRAQALQLQQQRVVHQRGPSPVPAMHDTVADDLDPGAVQVLLHPGEQRRQHRLMPGTADMRCIQRRPRRILGRKVLLVIDRLHLTPQDRPQPIEQRELQAAGPRIQRQDRH